ncbi:MAG: PAS domain-containing protein [Alphaproteobacteria bacterium]|nr:PAS domain-containing protein [Alphaproteobacteria bacterium]
MPNTLVISADAGLLARLGAKRHGRAKSTGPVRCAEDLAQALKAIQEEAPDLVLLDLAAPGGNGLAGIIGLRQEGVVCPVVAITDSENLDLIAASIEAGADDCITPDVEAIHLPRLVRMVAARRVQQLVTLDCEVKRRLGMVANSMPGVIYRRVMDREGRISFPLILGPGTERYGRETAEGLAVPRPSPRSRIHADDYPGWLDAVHRSAQTLDRFDNEMRMMRDDGSFWWVRSIAQPRRDADGSIVWDGVEFDITTSKEALARAQQSETRLARIADNLPGEIYRRVLRPDGTMSYEYVSPNVRGLYGVEPEMFEDDAEVFANLIHPDDRQLWRNAVNASALGLSRFDLEFRTKDGKGTYRWVRSVGQPHREPNGDVVWDGILIDVDATKRAEARADESAQHLARIAENIPGVVHRRILKPDGELLFEYVNPNRVRDFCGLGADSFVRDGQTFLRLMHLDDHDAYHRNIAASARDLSRFDMEMRVRFASGDYHWVRSISHPRRLDNGDIVWDGVTIDIDEARRAQEALREQETRLRSLAANMPGMVYQRVLHADGRVTYPYVSPGVKKIYGYEADEVMGESGIFPSGVVAEDRASYRKALEDSARNLTPRFWEGRERTKSGEIRWTQTYGQPRRLENGDVLWDGLIVDVTEGKLAQQALREREELLRSITSSIPGNVYRRIVHADGRISYPFVSWGLLSIYGLDPKGELADIGRFVDLAHPDDRAIYEDAFARSGRDLTPFDLVRRIVLPFGETKWIHGVAIPKRHANGDIVWDGVTFDVTEQKRAQEAIALAADEAQAASRAKSEFLANMSHELRTPLNAILGFSEVILDEVYGPLQPPNYLEYIRLVRDSGHHLLNVINDILDMSKIEAGRYDLEFERADLSQVIAECVTMVAAAAREKSITVENGMSGPLPLTRIDRRAAKQVFLNLLSNSVKFTGLNGKVSIVRGPTDKGWTEITVKDTGVGIPAEALERIFEPFQQADASLSRRHEGAGLGLSISRKFMELHGGTLTVRSKPGVGTEVTARFPIGSAA